MSNLKQTITGQAYWRSLEEYADSPAFQASLADEFADYAPDEIQAMSRRGFLKLAGAAMALAGLSMTGCRRWPKEELAPFATRPEDFLPGVPNYYASMTQRSGVAHPCLVAAFDGRPIKIESHPHAGVATDIFDQALTLQQYDPERAQFVANGTGDLSQRSSWSAFGSWFKKHLAELEHEGGEGLAVICEPESSPTLHRLRAEFTAKYPQAKWVTWEPLNNDNEAKGSLLALNRVVRTQYDLSNARVIACFDCDLLSTHASALSNARGWAQGRSSADPAGDAHGHGHGHDDHDDHAQSGPWMNRLYAVEPGMSITSGAADERLAVKPSQVAAVLTAVAAGVGVEGVSAPDLGEAQAFADKLVADLRANHSTSIVVAGPNQPAKVHALVHQINQHLGNVGHTINYTDDPTLTRSATSDSTQLDELTALTAAMNAGDVDTLLVLDANPVFDAPADLKFGEALAKVKHAVHLGLYHTTETAELCEWTLPGASNFEAWGDGRWYDGTLAIQQPLILPLFNGRSRIELLAAAVGESSLLQPTGYEHVRKTMRDLDGDSGVLSGADFESLLSDPGYAADQRGFEKDWRRAVHLGFVPGSQFVPVPITYTATVGAILPDLVDAGEMEISFRPGAVYDGRFANSPWLQEAPDAMSKVVWDNPVSMSVKDAAKLGVKYGDKVEVSVDGKTLELLAFIQPGQLEGTLIVQLGNGRKVCGHVGKEVGFDAYTLRGSKAMGFAAAGVKATGNKDKLATTSVHHLVAGFGLNADATGADAVRTRAGELGESGHAGNIIKEGSFADYKAGHIGHMMGHAHGDVSLQLYDAPMQETWTQRGEELMAEHPEAVAEGWKPRGAFNAPHAWGMTIDLNTCIGCNACTVACQAENNIPTVGKEQVWRSREMHWLRTDTYFKGDPDNAAEVQVVHQPIMCVQCENAPCEQVCPVAATVHDTEGMNTMVYNRCIGTRYCSNNCPYKVRRFNYFDFHAKSVRKDVPNPWLNMPDTQQNDAIDDIKSMVFNPDVTVRMRGVMEKCTYCTQRVQRAKIARKNAWVQNSQGNYGHEEAEDRFVPDGTIVTACQDACPTNCITFGDLNDPDSKVSKLQTKNQRAYSVLEELNSRPRTQHLAKLRNPFPSDHPEESGH